MENKNNENKQRINPEPQPPSNQPDCSKSFGSKMFDLSVYGGLGFVANASLSLAAERYARHVPTSSLYKWGQAGERFFKSGFSHLISDTKEVNYWADKSNQILFLGLGGWIMPVPIKMLEDRKIPIIQSIDSAFGTGPQTKEQKEAQAQALYTGPRQSYFSQYTGRLVSYTATIAVAAPLVTKWTRTSEHLTMALEKNVGRSIGSWYDPLIELEGMHGPTGKKVSAFLNASAVEAITAGTAATLHYGVSKFAALKGHNAHEPQPRPIGVPPLDLIDLAQAQNMPDNKVREAFHLATRVNEPGAETRSTA